MYVWTRAESARLLDAVAQAIETILVRAVCPVAVRRGRGLRAGVARVSRHRVDDDVGRARHHRRAYGVGIGALNAYTFRPVED